LSVPPETIRSPRVRVRGQDLGDLDDLARVILETGCSAS
jgi:hypothetical protein